ncbi:MAG: hypothetical protein IPJ65_07850 [Archangiaceae bacterium]|nr:hypothetical protein [Archangiaceae bacterium]
MNAPPTSSKTARLAALGLSIAVGVALGLVADALAGDVPMSTKTVTDALLLSPFAIPAGAGAVATGFGATVMLLGGFLFWPGLLVLAWRYLKAPHVATAVACAVWSTQGFFMIVHRTMLIMSA